MSQWFECKVKYDRTMENGAMKTVSEPYLVDALSFTEAEARITDKMQPYISGEFKTNFITIDEKTAVVNRTASYQLVQASELKGALAVFMEGMHDTMADFEIASIAETPLMDVFPVDLDETRADREARQKAQNQ